MRTFSRSLLTVLFVLALAPLAQAQEAASEAGFVGTWTVDMAAMTQGLTPEEQAAIGAMAVTMTFNPDYTMTMQATDPTGAPAESDTGTWSVVSAEGNTLVIAGTGSDGETQNITVLFNTPTNITMTDPDGESLTLNKNP